MYNKGSHILSTFKVHQTELLQDHLLFKSLIDKLILDNELENVGETYHSFTGAGFTAYVCLTESHLSIHTWPEYGLATFDVFLSNFKHNNSNKVKNIFESVKLFFDAEIESYHLIER